MRPHRSSFQLGDDATVARDRWWPRLVGPGSHICMHLGHTSCTAGGLSAGRLRGQAFRARPRVVQYVCGRVAVLNKFRAVWRALQRLRIGEESGKSPIRAASTRLGMTCMQSKLLRGLVACRTAEGHLRVASCSAEIMRGLVWTCFARCVARLYVPPRLSAILERLKRSFELGSRALIGQLRSSNEAPHVWPSRPRAHLSSV